ncbi:copper homeostasis protein cutC homolog [Branchiostoma floridae]|uniref:Copper homeostasis protein cutC homolog n=1 Tax=Branchiostoma floridae TaxID=7739 RepID=A0A9J7L220_BRAFL|nr:copper homeostasis protein cutC homolog [Branchiostoma floridae]XP_035674189.1 copper homeostasis protein cutC homolog [Branchiostoma floridae]XP_035674190.1 copper homeostasis protein cutC homolog [Branchiostoma floridae]XP_035674191.1 copper homeostasis protein cutC homolog [Branchiostoma floridae]
MAAMLNVGDEFSTWAEFSEALEAFQEAHHVELSKVTSKTVANENRQLPQNVDKFPEEHIYRAVKFGCIHHGKPRSRSTGIRGNHASFKMGCPAEIYVSSDRKKRKLVIKTLNNNHNHEVNEEVLKLSPSKRILGGDFLEEASSRTRYTMEVCVDSVESAVNAEDGGASRLELCGNLMEGGTTPTLGLLRVVKQKVRIPVYVMIRPRGGDFLYSITERQVMMADLCLAKEEGADGIVLGALTEDGRIDKDLCMELIVLARPLPVTFHRAFDMVEDPSQALEDVISLGCERLLTSGCDSTVLEGLPTLKKLTEQARGRITIVPGGGINERNLPRVLEGTGAREFHCSASSFKQSGMAYRNTAVCMGGALRPPEFGYKVASTDRVRTLNQIAESTVQWSVY